MSLLYGLSHQYPFRGGLTFLGASLQFELGSMGACVRLGMNRSDHARWLHGVYTYIKTSIHAGKALGSVVVAYFCV